MNDPATTTTTTTGSVLDGTVPLQFQVTLQTKSLIILGVVLIFVVVAGVIASHYIKKAA
jgi:hypothetical protein